ARYVSSVLYVRYVFFFQAEDGIRDWSVTGVQTCALPICHLQMPLVLVYRELGQQGAEGSLRIADETQIDLGPPAELLTPHIDLDDRRLLGKELLVREVRTDHQEEIAGHHSVVAGRESEETRHAHVE